MAPPLEDQFLDHFANGQFPLDVDEQDLEFLPIDSIEHLVTQDSVARKFKLDSKPEKWSTEDKALVAWTVQSAKRAFATAVWGTLTGDLLREAISIFKQHGFDDSHLPIKTEVNLAELPYFPSRLWSRVRLKNFKKDQWKFLAPVFPANTSQLDLEQGHILPFTWVDEAKREGFFGNVYQVTIHPSHQKEVMLKADKTPANAAIKELKTIITEDLEAQKPEDREAIELWLAEKKALLDTSALKHEHIVEVKAFITKGNKKNKRHYFMFQWADGGCLRDFYQEIKHPTLEPGFVKEIIVQLAGLADAINELHNWEEGSYRHGDLKPENILRFKDNTKVGILKVADMGLAKHHYAPTRARRIATSSRYGTPFYEPPEVYTRSKEARSRLYDIWSMGCIILELIIWLLYGYDVLHKFHSSMMTPQGNSIPFWLIEDEDGKKTAVLHPTVIECLDRIAQDPECSGSSAMGDLFRIVRRQLLVVRLPQDTRTMQSDDSEFDTRSSTPTGLPTITVDGSGLSVPGPAIGQSRAKATGLCSALQDILDRGEKNPGYWCVGKERNGITGPAMKKEVFPAFLSPEGVDVPVPLVFRTKKPSSPLSKSPVPPPSPSESTPGLLAPSQQPGMIDYAHPPLNDIWEFPVDNKFPVTIFPSEGSSNNLPNSAGTAKLPVGNGFQNRALVSSPHAPQFFPKSTETAKLCGRCESMDFWASSFRFKDNLTELEKSSKSCHFCNMRWNICKNLDQHEHKSVHFDRLESMIRMNETYPPVFTLCRQPGNTGSTAARQLQIGLPQLPEVGSVIHMDIIRQWLKNCDENHPSCKRPGTKLCLPTRLVDVGSSSSSTVKIYETRPGDTMPFFALSHLWGQPPYFCTNTKNIEAYKQGIPFDELPATFQHAVTVTRALGLRHLWIDSLCIIQGPGGDFDSEAKRMEDVFSRAHAVLATTSVTGQYDGFLKERPPERRRKYLTFPPREDGQPPFYVCEFMDDFNRDVLESPLNRRGWVLQERALARRTIFFTETQTYWECGEGVRCETLTRMHNKLASFLGDPNFPEVAIKSSHGGKIRLFQDLYMQYSRLAFTRQTDRPVAIAGLEKRLIQSFGVHGGFGVLEGKRENAGLLRRSLLWNRRSDEQSLEKINFRRVNNGRLGASLGVKGADALDAVSTGSTAPPTWSWMAYKGKIEYLDLPFDGVEWEGDEIRTPWSPAEDGVWYSVDESAVTELTAVAREFNVKAAAGADARVVYDVPFQSDGPHLALRCVVVGRQKGMSQTLRERRHYIIVVAPSPSHMSRGSPVYSRIGVGYLPGKLIELDNAGFQIKIR